MISWILASVVVLLTALWLFSKRGCVFRVDDSVALDASKFRNFKLIQKIPVNHNSYIFRFALHRPTQVLGLPVGQHVYIRAAVEDPEGKFACVQHAYTPISSNDDVGHVDFLVKVYRGGVHPDFPRGGRLSQHLHRLPLGGRVEMRGPAGRFAYLGGGDYTIGGPDARRSHADAFAMVAGGTGITPMLQLLRAIVRSPDDRTKVWLLYANQTEADILLRDELDEYARSPRVRVWYILSRETPPGWKYSCGRVDEATLRAHVPIPRPGSGENDDDDKKKKEGGDGDDGDMRVVALMCGPTAMIQLAVKPGLEKIGYKADDMFVF